MALEVYSSAKPAIRHRAALLSMLVFAITASLAAGLSYVRSNSPLGPRIAPQGWGVSLRLPRQLTVARGYDTRSHDWIDFHGSEDSPQPATFSLHRVQLRPGESLDDAARLVLRDNSDLVYLIQLFNPPALERNEGLLGGVAGVEFHDPETGARARCVMAEARRALCFALRPVPESSVDEQASLFRASCESVRFERRD